MIKKLYNWTISLASHTFAIGFLAVIAFLESSIFPIPPDVLLIALVLASRDKAWIMASVCTVFSVIGGLFGYIIGFFLLIFSMFFLILFPQKVLLTIHKC